MCPVPQFAMCCPPDHRHWKYECIDFKKSSKVSTNGIKERERSERTLMSEWNKSMSKTFLLLLRPITEKKKAPSRRSDPRQNNERSLELTLR